MPDAVSIISPHHKIIHSSTYSTSIQSILSSLPPPRNASVKHSHHPVKVAVIGGGQSAAEVVIDLRSKLQDVLPLPPDEKGNPMRHEIDLIINKGSLKPSDDSQFSNEIFDPACTCMNIYPHAFHLILSLATDMLFNLRTKAARDIVLKEFRATNYGVVNPHTIDNVSQLFSWCLFHLTLVRSFSSCCTINRSTIPLLNGRNLMKRPINNPSCHLVSPSAITPLLSP